MTQQTVKVILLSSPPNQSFLEFSLIFEDNCEKHYMLDGYAIKAMRGASERDIIEEQARIYFELLGQEPDVIKLVFL